MAMYQYRQSEEKLEQDLKTQKKSNRLNTKTKTNTETTTETKLKRILQVYKKYGKFYIDQFAAYALKLTNVRAVMTDEPRLTEVSLDFLQEMENNEEVEIEYKELKGSIDIGSNNGNVNGIVDGLEQGEYGIGIHGIDQGDSKEKYSKAEGIIEQGLFINNNSKTILSTSISLGPNEETQQLSEELTQYKFGNGPKYNVLIAVPLQVQNENGESIFLGFPEKNKTTSGQQYEEHCILDRICARMKKIPPEFILGYYYEDIDGSGTFVDNTKHYSKLSIEEKERLYTQLSDNMDDISKRFNELISNGNMEQLRQMQQIMQERDLHTYMVDSAIMLAEKYQGSRGKMGRRILQNLEPNDDKTTENGVSVRVRSQRPVSQNLGSNDDKTAENGDRRARAGSRRRLLLGLYQSANIEPSDLSAAKEALKEALKDGIERQGIIQEGNEIE